MLGYLFIVSLICMLVCFGIARKRNLNPSLWVALGSVLGPIAVLLALFLPAPKQVSQLSS